MRTHTHTHTHTHRFAVVYNPDSFLEVAGSNLRPKANFTEVFRAFSQSLQANVGTVGDLNKSNQNINGLHN
jgi:hypothetical protein